MVHHYESPPIIKEAQVDKRLGESLDRGGSLVHLKLSSYIKFFDFDELACLWHETLKDYSELAVVIVTDGVEVIIVWADLDGVYFQIEPV